MLVSEAKAVARQWVDAEASRLPGFDGAFFHGSINWLGDNDTLPATSDLDVMVVLAEREPPHKPGKFVYQDVLLEVSYIPAVQLPSADVVLGQSHLAGSFHVPSIIADPSGWLIPLQQAVAQEYAKRRWVRTRCVAARDKVLRNLRSINGADPFHEQVMGWLFATGVTTHVLLVAGLQNPTVRKRYGAVRDLLTAYDRLDFYEPLLDLLGCGQMGQACAMQHLDALTAAFDAAKGVIKTPFFFAADISDMGRAVAIDGSRELIERGDQREAIFWMVATYSRCQMVFHQDAPAAMQAQFQPGYRALLADLGITSVADLQARGAQVEAQLPAVWAVAEAIMEANPDIEE